MSALARVVVTGGECTGKTTLARLLAAAFDVPWAPEFARAYAAARGGVLGPADVLPIMEGQVRGEQAALRAAEERGAPCVVLDTDLASTLTYARLYYGTCPEAVRAAARARRAPLYLLCAPDLPWQPDGIRDRPHDREAVDAAFRATLAELGATVVEIAGTGEARPARAREALAALLARRAAVCDPRDAGRILPPFPEGAAPGAPEDP